MNPINWSKSKKSKKPDVREWFSRFFRVFFRKPDKYDRNCPLLWKTPADRKSFEIIKTLAIRRLHFNLVNCAVSEISEILRNGRVERFRELRYNARKIFYRRLN